ncbi:transposase family protein [Micromonospora sp. M71_S20]|uniref:helix-turn-helix domain-containing protein n=1 Tax=Micromonospora sp. M71_S20 TaxID=592872 RepID=UPI001F26638A|nr:transposase family protein [Micromonospora sp. M71_S20]
MHLRHGLTHDVVAAWFGVHRSTISRSIAEVRPLLAERGCRVHDGVRLRNPVRRGGAPRVPPAGVDGRHRGSGTSADRGAERAGPVCVRQGRVEHDEGPGDL